MQRVDSCVCVCMRIACRLNEFIAVNAMQVNGVVRLLHDILPLPAINFSFNLKPAKWVILPLHKCTILVFSLSVSLAFAPARELQRSSLTLANWRKQCCKIPKVNFKFAFILSGIVHAMPCCSEVQFLPCILMCLPCFFSLKNRIALGWLVFFFLSICDTGVLRFGQKT